MQKWWNWQTRKTKDLVLAKGVRVRVPPSAPDILLTSLDLSEVFFAFNTENTESTELPHWISRIQIQAWIRKKTYFKFVA